jgi:hypothetical protein
MSFDTEIPISYKIYGGYFCPNVRTRGYWVGNMSDYIINEGYVLRLFLRAK